MFTRTTARVSTHALWILLSLYYYSHRNDSFLHRHQTYFICYTNHQSACRILQLTISSKTLFQNMKLPWKNRQKLNLSNVPTIWVIGGENKFFVYVFHFPSYFQNDSFIRLFFSGKIATAAEQKQQTNKQDELFKWICSRRCFWISVWCRSWMLTKSICMNERRKKIPIEVAMNANAIFYFVIHSLNQYSPKNKFVFVRH